MFGFRGTGHFEKSSLALLATSSIGRILWTNVHEVESHVLGFMPPALEKAALPLEGRRKLSCRGKPGGKRAVAMLLSGNAVDPRVPSSGLSPLSIQISTTLNCKSNSMKDPRCSPCSSVIFHPVTHVTDSIVLEAIGGEGEGEGEVVYECRIVRVPYCTSTNTVLE